MQHEEVKNRYLIERGWSLVVREDGKTDLLHISRNNVIIRNALWAATICGDAYYHRADIVANFENLEDFWLCPLCGPPDDFTGVVADLKARINAQGGRP